MSTNNQTSDSSRFGRITDDLDAIDRIIADAEFEDGEVDGRRNRRNLYRAQLKAAARAKYLPLFLREPRLRDSEIAEELGVSREAVGQARKRFTDLTAVPRTPAAPRIPGKLTFLRWLREAGYKYCPHCYGVVGPADYDHHHHLCEPCAKVYRDAHQKAWRARMRENDPVRLQLLDRGRNQRRPKKTLGKRRRRPVEPISEECSVIA